MQFNEPVRQATFLKRYKRFFADVRVDQNVLTAHVPNTGSLKSCLEADADCLVTETNDPNRKLKATLQFIKTPTSWVGVNTSLPNDLVYELWESRQIPHWKKFGAAKREYKISKETRFDLALAETAEALEHGRVHLVEVKNVTLAENGVALFPDAVTTRGQKHLEELTTIVKNGGTAEMVYVVQRTDCPTFRPADDIDPDYGRLLRAAAAAGVWVQAYACEFAFDDLARARVKINPRPLPLDL